MRLGLDLILYLAQFTLKKDAFRDHFLITYGFDSKCGLHLSRPNQTLSLKNIMSSVSLFRNVTLFAFNIE